MEEKKQEYLKKKTKLAEAVKEVVEGDENEDNSPMYEDVSTPEKNEVKRTRIDMGPFVAELTRYSCGDRCGAALWNAATLCLTNAGFLQKDEEDISIDDCLKANKSKIGREKSKFSAKEKEIKDEFN